MSQINRVLPLDPDPALKLPKNNIIVKSGHINPLIDAFNEISPAEGELSADTISEFTPGAGVTVDGVLIKDGGITSSGYFVGLILDSAEQTLTGAGAVNITAYSTRLNATGAGQALTLADGSVNGQLKEITMDSVGAPGDTGVLTPTTASGFTTITFDATADNVLLIWNATAPGWRVIRNSGATVA